VHELRQKFPVVGLLKVIDLPKSSFYYWDKVRQQPDKDERVNLLIEDVCEVHKRRYGYRRVASVLAAHGESIHENTVRRRMQKLNLQSTQRYKRFKSYKGEVGKTARNWLNRNFKASRPNQKWVTDVTEFKVGQQKLYLSPIKDLYSGEIIAYTVNERPVFDMVKSMLQQAVSTLNVGDKPLLHSDQGWHYRMDEYRGMLKSARIKQSMSRKANCHDNASMESFFAVLKAECFHGRQFSGIEELKKEIDEYIEYYNHDRIGLRLGGMSPVQYRQQYAKVR
jgi:putative transposase